MKNATDGQDLMTMHTLRIAGWHARWTAGSFGSDTPDDLASEYINHDCEINSDGNIWNANCNCWFGDDKLEEFVQFLRSIGHDL